MHTSWDILYHHMCGFTHGCGNSIALPQPLHYHWYTVQIYLISLYIIDMSIYWIYLITLYIINILIQGIYLSKIQEDASLSHLFPRVINTIRLIGGALTSLQWILHLLIVIGPGVVWSHTMCWQLFIHLIGAGIILPWNYPQVHFTKNIIRK